MIPVYRFPDNAPAWVLALFLVGLVAGIAWLVYLVC